MSHSFIAMENLYGKDAFDNIKKAHICIIGLGGVGSWCAELLARSGVEQLTLVDLDDICISNINRQVMATTETLGQFKVHVMADRLRQINPQIKINPRQEFFTANTADQILNHQYDMVIDAIDSVQNKCLIIEECKKRNLPFICTGAAGARLDPTAVMIKDINRTINDKLLFRVRKKLRKDFGYKRFHDRPFKIPTVFSSEVPQESPPLESEFATGRNCQSGLGSAGFVTVAFAMAAVSYTVEQIKMSKSNDY